MTAVIEHSVTNDPRLKRGQTGVENPSGIAMTELLDEMLGRWEDDDLLAQPEVESASELCTESE